MKNRTGIEMSLLIADYDTFDSDRMNEGKLNWVYDRNLHMHNILVYPYTYKEKCNKTTPTRKKIDDATVSYSTAFVRHFNFFGRGVKFQKDISNVHLETKGRQQTLLYHTNITWKFILENPRLERYTSTTDVVCMVAYFCHLLATYCPLLPSTFLIN